MFFTEEVNLKLHTAEKSSDVLFDAIPLLFAVATPFETAAAMLVRPLVWVPVSIVIQKLDSEHCRLYQVRPFVCSGIKRSQLL